MITHILFCVTITLMIKIKMKSTGEIKEVNRNIAHDLIDKGQAELIIRPLPKTVPQVYKTTVLSQTQQKVK